MRVGIFGGSFDPPHLGHLLVAQDAIDALSLDLLLVVPAGVQPLKQGRRTAAEHRLAMVRHCFEGVPKVVVDSMEIDRGGLSFMVDTVEQLRRRWPAATLHLLVGADVVSTLPQWREPERLLSMVQLVVLDRADAPAPDANVPSAIRLATRRIDLSSTEIRARVRDRRSIRGFVPDAVAAYIASTALYLSEPETAPATARA